MFDTPLVVKNLLHSLCIEVHLLSLMLYIYKKGVKMIVSVTLSKFP